MGRREEGEVNEVVGKREEGNEMVGKREEGEGNEVVGKRGIKWWGRGG